MNPTPASLLRGDALRFSRRGALADVDEVLLALQALLDRLPLVVVAAGELLADERRQRLGVLELARDHLERAGAATLAAIDDEAVLLQGRDAVGFLGRQGVEHRRPRATGVEALRERPAFLAVALGRGPRRARVANASGSLTSLGTA